MIPANTRLEIDIRRIKLFHAQRAFWVFLRGAGRIGIKVTVDERFQKGLDGASEVGRCR